MHDEYDILRQCESRHPQCALHFTDPVVNC